MPSTSSSSSTTAKGGGTTRQQQSQSQQQQHRRSTSPTKVQQPPHPSHEFTFAKRTLRKLVEDSTFFRQMDNNNNDDNDDNLNHVGTIHERDVQVGALLGQGGFCEVRYCYTAAAAVKRKNPKLQQQHQDVGANETPSPSSNNNKHMGRYAIKYLSPSRTAPHPSDPKNKVFQRGIADLAMEACFLSLLSHTNIITCHYVSVGSLEENFNTEVDYTTTHHHGGSNAALGGGGNSKVKMKKRFKEEIVLDAMGNLVLKEVPIIADTTDEEGEDDSNQQENNEQQQQQQQVEKYKHRFGYFLLLDVLHETLAHRIDHVYIPQVLLSSSSSNTNIKGRPSSPSNASLGGCGSSSISSSSIPSTDLTSSLLLHTQEKRDSFLKRIAKRSSLFHKQHQNNNRGSVVDSNSSSAPGIRSITYANNNNNNNNNNHHHHDNNDNVEVQHQPPHSTSHSHPHNLIYNQKQKLAHRLTSLLSIANALQYLHEHKIIFRDIKPDNIGFYREYSAVCTCGLRPSSSSSSATTATTTTPFGGQQQQPQHQEDDNTMNDLCTCYIEIPKLFDFGLAKELKSKYRVEDGHTRLRANSRDYSEIKEYAHHDHHYHRGAGGLLGRNFSSSSSAASGIGIGSTRNRISDEEMNTVYKLTGCTGSRRYMAPEVCFNDPYNEKADVYSFGMMLYQVASLVTPFDGYSSYDHEKEVLRGGFRPDIDLPTKKDLLACKKIEEELYANLGSTGGSSSSGEEDGGGGDNKLLLPPPSEKRNEVLAIKSKSVWTKDLKRLIDECWDYDMRYRPPMKEVVVRLQGCIDELILPPQQLLQQKQQQKKGRDSLDGKKMTDVIRGSRTNNVTTQHRQQGGNNSGDGGKNDNVVVEGKTKQKGSVGGAGAVEVRSNVSDEDNHSRESVKKKSFFRPPTSPRKESNAAAAAAIQQ